MKKQSLRIIIKIEIIAESKRSYYYKIADKLHSTQRSSKAYRSLLRRFLNRKNIPLISPVFHNNEVVTGFKKEVSFFYLILFKQYSLNNNNSKTPNKFYLYD